MRDRRSGKRFEALGHSGGALVVMMLAAAAAWAVAASSAPAQTTEQAQPQTRPRTAAHGAVVLVRHAHKLDDSDGSPLSEAGAARAAELASLLKDAGVTAIFTTEYRRNIDTAAPLATLTGVTPVIVPGRQIDALVERLKATAPGDLTVMVGHSNTIPQVLTRLGHEGAFEIKHDAYDDLFVVLPRPGGPPSVLRLKY